MSDTLSPPFEISDQTPLTHAEQVLPNPHISEYPEGLESPPQEVMDSYIQALNAERKAESEGVDPRVLPLGSSVIKAAETARKATSDKLSGLLNREGIEMWYDRYAPQHMGIISADIIDFKSINDAHGEEYGDRVISFVGKEFAKQLRTSEKPIPENREDARTAKDTKDVVAVARWGGDEAIAIVNLDNVVSYEDAQLMRDAGKTDEEIELFKAGERERVMGIIQQRLLNNFGTYKDDENDSGTEIKIRSAYKIAQKNDDTDLEQHIKELNDGVVDIKKAEKLTA